MKAIREKNTNKIIYIGEDFILTEHGLSGEGLSARNIKPDLYEKIDIKDTPDNFRGGCYTFFDGVWKKTQVGLDYDEEMRLEKLKQKISDLARIRWERETAGIMVNGSKIRTDRESQAMIIGAYTAVQIDPERIINWKGKDDWVQLNATAIATITKAVINHVQACFSHEKELVLLIEMGIDCDITTGW